AGLAGDRAGPRLDTPRRSRRRTGAAGVAGSGPRRPPRRRAPGAVRAERPRDGAALVRHAEPAPPPARRTGARGARAHRRASRDGSRQRRAGARGAPVPLAAVAPVHRPGGLLARPLRGGAAARAGGPTPGDDARPGRRSGPPRRVPRPAVLLAPVPHPAWGEPVGASGAAPLNGGRSSAERTRGRIV